MNSMQSKDMRMALFKKGMVRCRACAKHLRAKDCAIKDDPDHRRLIVKMRCTNPNCKLFGRDVEWYVPTDKFMATDGDKGHGQGVHAQEARV